MPTLVWNKKLFLTKYASKRIILVDYKNDAEKNSAIWMILLDKQFPYLVQE